MLAAVTFIEFNAVAQLYTCGLEAVEVHTLATIVIYGKENVDM